MNLYTPPAIHGFPPFYTLQPNGETQTAQLDQWCSIVVQWAAAEGVWALDAKGDPLPPSKTATIFANGAVSRKCSQELLAAVFAQLRARGNALDGPDGTLLLLPRPVSFYADELRTKLEESGVTNVMLTLYELQEDYTTLPMSHLQLALNVLQDAGFLKVVLDEDTGEAMGIKVS